MGLTIIVGQTAELEGDEIAEYAEEIERIQFALSAAGVTYWAEPAVGESSAFEMRGYSCLHSLRRLAAHVAAAGDLPEPGDDDAPSDPVLTNLYELGPRYAAVIDEDGEHVTIVGARSDDSFDHLVHHSDAEGFYVPVDFEPVILDPDIIGHAVGSSYRLLDECRRLAGLLHLPEDLDPDSPEVEAAYDRVGDALNGWRRYGPEAYACLQLMAAARRSIETGAAIVFA